MTGPTAFALDVEEIKALTVNPYAEESVDCERVIGDGVKFDPESPFEASEGFLISRKKVSFFDKIVVKAAREDVPNYKCSLEVLNGGNKKVTIAKGGYFQIVEKVDHFGSHGPKVIRHCKSGIEFSLVCPSIFIEKNKVSKLKVTSQDVVDAFSEYFDFHIVTGEEVLD